MSTDLEFRQDHTLEIRLPTIKIKSSEPSNDENCSSTDDQDCQTPKSPQHMIPKILICPPAPKKPTRAPSCKRKLSELQFFNVVLRDEIESFFKLAETSTINKRRCFV